MSSTYWDFEYEVERCSNCDKIIVDSWHECGEEPLDENNYSDRLTRGFEMLDMEGD